MELSLSNTPLRLDAYPRNAHNASPLFSAEAFLLLLFLLGYPAGAVAEERDTSL